MERDEIILDYVTTKQDQKQLFYKSPLPKKRQRVTARGRSGKVKHWTEEQVFVENCRRAKALMKGGACKDERINYADMECSRK